MSVTLTPRAALHVRTALERRGHGVGLRLGVRTAGCSGMSYVLEFADASAPDDVRFDSEGVALLVDPKSLVLLDGTELDFVREGLSEGFRFSNPNAKSTCSCGDSFSA